MSEFLDGWEAGTRAAARIVQAIEATGPEQERFRRIAVGAITALPEPLPTPAVEVTPEDAAAKLRHARAEAVKAITRPAPPEPDFSDPVYDDVPEEFP